MKMKTKIIHTISFLAVLLLILAGFARLLLPVSRIGLYQKQPDNSLDYLFIGDSECKTSMSPVQIYEETGYRGFNCGQTAQPIQETYYDLKTYLKNQKPQVVFLETNTLFRAQNTADRVESAALSTLSYAVPVMNFHGDWKYYLTKSKKVQTDRSQLGTLYGWHFSMAHKPYTGSADYMLKTNRREPIAKGQLNDLDDIRELCDKNGVQLILFSIPSPKNWNTSHHNTIADYAEKYGLTYLDLNENTKDIGINWKTDTGDSGDHLNVKGAFKVSRYMAKWMQGSLSPATTSAADKAWKANEADYDKIVKPFLTKPLRDPVRKSIQK